MSEAVTTEQQRREYIESLMAGERERSERTDLRAMLACWAPQEIPVWFKCEKPERPRDVWMGSESGKVYQSPFDAEREEGFDHYYNANSEAIMQWELDCLRTRYFAWRVYYADRMLECLAK